MFHHPPLEMVTLTQQDSKLKIKDITNKPRTSISYQPQHIKAKIPTIMAIKVVNNRATMLTKDILKLQLIIKSQQHHRHFTMVPLKLGTCLTLAMNTSQQLAKMLPLALELIKKLFLPKKPSPTSLLLQTPVHA
jgi:hypothetical protein